MDVVGNIENLGSLTLETEKRLSYSFLFTLLFLKGSRCSVKITGFNFQVLKQSM